MLFEYFGEDDQDDGALFYSFSAIYNEKLLFKD